MPDDIRLSDQDKEFEDTDEGLERGIGESEDEFDDDDEDGDEDEEEEDEDEDLDSPRGVADDRSFTSEIGSEGGSQGDIETERKPRVMRGSEAGTTAETGDERAAFHDRQAGSGVGGPRH